MTGQDSPPQNDGFEAAIDSLEQQLSTLWRRARANSHRVAREVHPDMEPAAYGLLTVLQREESMRLTDLAANIGVGKPSVSRQVAMLEQLGLVQKQTDPSDGRAQSITLTELGMRKLESAQAARKSAFIARLDDWPVADLNALAGLLDRLNRSYRNESPPATGHS
ncbi:MarR family transcriptional regulator [Arthrobacter crystallopoietes BAB-32]|uniref:MarR family transcriptional regulator n=1 Tax=Arthrobacter crystallopoietes BAB-32 TaxID=1246476 RepID=N1UXM5_9MICC|nr:MarR family transcriptional regulator [Arthrobacter crystallopoietes]EMY35151.1 MarR family transcriptional regulator [Arthrobacter crystallopoietes BAB-32]